MEIINFTPLPAILGGVLIGTAASLMLGLLGRVAGISGILSNLLSFNFVQNLWRYLFIIGLILGTYLGYIAEQGPQTITMTTNKYLIAMGGFMVGFGALLGGGCTSGHGVCGISRLSSRSMVATLVFMSSAITVVMIKKIWF